MDDIAVQRRLTLEFIAHRPTTIALTPQERVSNGKGGWRKVAGTQRLPITVTLVPQTAFVESQRNTRTAEGEVDDTVYILIAPHDAVVEEDDTFTDDTGVYRVNKVYPPNGYQVKASVVHHAG